MVSFVLCCVSACCVSWLLQLPHSLWLSPSDTTLLLSVKFSSSPNSVTEFRSLLLWLRNGVVIIIAFTRKRKMLSTRKRLKLRVRSWRRIPNAPLLLPNWSLLLVALEALVNTQFIFISFSLFEVVYLQNIIFSIMVSWNLVSIQLLMHFSFHIYYRKDIFGHLNASRHLWEREKREENIVMISDTMW